MIVALAPMRAFADDPSFLSFGAGYFDFNRGDNTSTEFRAEYRSDYKLWVVKPFAGAMVNTDSAAAAYGGILMDLYFGRRFVLTPSFAPALYRKGHSVDLGYALEFRSAIELSYRFDDRTRLGISLYHMSNAHLANRNPGTEVIGIVYSIPLGPGSH